MRQPSQSGDDRGAARDGGSRQPEHDVTDPVDETSKDSFPASDAPSWTPVVGVIAGAVDARSLRNRRDDSDEQRMTGRTPAAQEPKPPAA